MRLFLIMDSNGAEMIPLGEALEQRGHEIIYWVGSSAEIRKEFPGAVYHGHFDARAGIPADGINAQNFPPLDTDLIKKMNRSESIAMTIVRKTHGHMGIIQFRHCYYELLQYWYGVIKKFNPEFIIFSVSPHSLYNFIIHELADLLGIPMLMFEDTWLSDRAVCYENYHEGSPDLRSAIQRNKEKQYKISDLSSDIRDYYLMQNDISKDSTPSYTKKQKKQFSGLNLLLYYSRIFWKNFWKGNALKIVFGYIKKRMGQNPKKEYFRLQIKPDLSRNYVYVALHMQPERSTSPQGDIFADQILMIEMLADALPEGWVLYVKEHPAQWWNTGLNYSLFRFPGFYRKIARLKNVFLVPVDSNHFELLNKSRAVATIAGNSGQEALLRHKPILVFGYVWYRDCPGAFKVSSRETCSKALRDIASGFKIDPQDIINFLKSFDETSIHCYVDDFEEKNSSFSKQERINNLTTAVLAKLHKEN